MSAYAHQMEQQFSAQSISSRGGSAGTDVGSQYPTESGFYMTSFAATIFIAAIVTIGILMVTMLITLTVMLRSCESKSAGIIENMKLDDDYNRCKRFSVHAELNSLRTPDFDFPSNCKSLAVRYVKEGQYGRDLNDTLWMAESYFAGVAPLEDGLDTVLMDIDDVLISKSQCDNLPMHCDSIKEAKTLKRKLVLTLYNKLQAGGWKMILISKIPAKQQTAATYRLISAGFNDWSSLIMRPDSELHISNYEYFSRRREAIHKQGFRITCSISSQIDALAGPSSGKHVLKLPNPIYYSFEHYSENLFPVA